METHVTGAQRGSRRGSVESVQSIPIDFASATSDFTIGTAKKILTINATVARPVFVEVYAVVQTTSNASGTATLSVGITGAGYTDLVSGTNAKNSANSTAISRVIYTAKSDIYAITAASSGYGTAGKMYLLFKLVELNVVKVK